MKKFAQQFTYIQLDTYSRISTMSNIIVYQWPGNLLADPLTQHIAAVGTAWSLLGSPRNGKAALYLVQKTFAVLSVHL
jgi:hypothetical protein